MSFLGYTKKKNNPTLTFQLLYFFLAFHIKRRYNVYLCFDSLISFEEKSTAKEMEYVTIEADICRYLLQIGDATNEFFSEETASVLAC